MILGWCLWSVASVLADDACADRGLFALRPGVLVEQDRSRVYLMSPRGGIDAVDLASGTLSWSTMRAAKPLILAGDVLVAQANVPGRPTTLRLVGLDVLQGGRATFEADLELPAGVEVSIEDGLGTSFRTDAWLQGQAVMLSWAFSRLYVEGPPPQDPGSLLRKVSGAVWMDPQRGQLRRLTPDETAALSRPGDPAIGRFPGAGPPSGPLWNTGSVVASVKRLPGNRTHGVVLLRWKCATAEALPEVSLFSADYTLRYPSVDQKHLLASKSDRATQPPWHWLIFSIDAGTRVAQINMESPGAPFFIWRHQLMVESPAEDRFLGDKRVEQPLRLRALDLGSGRELWSWPIRDTAYRGPYPPRRR